MALVKFSAVVAEARGKEGGTIFSRNASGGYIKTKVTPTNPRTVYQQEQRGLMGSIAQSWKGLSRAVQTQWKSFAEQVPQTNVFGDQIVLSGFNAYVRSSRNLSVLGMPPLQTPGAVPSFPNLSNVALTAGGTKIELSFDVNGDASTVNSVVDATPGVGAGKSFVNNLYRMVAPLAEELASPIDFTTQYNDRFGALPLNGMLVYARIRLIDLGSGWDTSYYTAYATKSPV